MLRILAVTTVAVAGFLASPALGRSLQCNKQQTKCVTETKELTIGDRVGIFNDEGELVATGEIKSMRGDKRAVLIRKRHGTIHKGYDLALMENQATDADYSAAYRVYKEPPKLQAGASLGYSSVSVGGGSIATELSGYGQWRKWNGLQLIARGVYTAMEGEVTRYDDFGAERLPISMQGFGLLGGAGYIMREGKPVSFRAEGAIGAMYISATIGGEKGLVNESDSNSKMKNGVGAYGRWSLGAVWNLSMWHVHADFVQSLAHQAFANTLAMGMSKDIR